jgi:hypothetical protein
VCRCWALPGLRHCGITFTCKVASVDDQLVSSIPARNQDLGDDIALGEGRLGVTGPGCEWGLVGWGGGGVRNCGSCEPHGMHTAVGLPAVARHAPS